MNLSPLVDTPVYLVWGCVEEEVVLVGMLFCFVVIETPATRLCVKRLVV